MRNVSELKKALKQTKFPEFMERLRFEKGPNGLWFYRSRGILIDVLLIQPLAGGNGMRLHLSTTTLDLLTDFDRDRFPRGFYSAFGNVSRLFLTKKGIRFAGYDWPTEDEVQVRESVLKICEFVRSDLIPWYNNIRTRKDLYDSIHDDVKYDNGSFSEHLVRVLLVE